MWKFSASTNQVSVQLIWKRVKEPNASSSQPKPVLIKNKPPSTRRRDATRYDQWLQAKISAEVITPTTSVDQSHHREANTSIEGNREKTPTKYLRNTKVNMRGSSLKRTSSSVRVTPERHAINNTIFTQPMTETSDVGSTTTKDLT